MDTSPAIANARTEGVAEYIRHRKDTGASPVYVEVFGRDQGQLLSLIGEADKWVVLTNQEAQDSTGMTINEITRARKKLERLGVLDTQSTKVPNVGLHVLHWRIDGSVLSALVNKHLSGRK
jgi:hypothetical protein